MLTRLFYFPIIGLISLLISLSFLVEEVVAMQGVKTLTRTPSVRSTSSTSANLVRRRAPSTSTPWKSAPRKPGAISQPRRTGVTIGARRTTPAASRPASSVKTSTTTLPSATRSPVARPRSLSATSRPVSSTSLVSTGARAPVRRRVIRMNTGTRSPVSSLSTAKAAEWSGVGNLKSFGAMGLGARGSLDDLALLRTRLLGRNASGTGSRSFARSSGVTPVDINVKKAMEMHANGLPKYEILHRLGYPKNINLSDVIRLQSQGVPTEEIVRRMRAATAATPAPTSVAKTAKSTGGASTPIPDMPLQTMKTKGASDVVSPIAALTKSRRRSASDGRATINDLRRGAGPSASNTAVNAAKRAENLRKFDALSARASQSKRASQSASQAKRVSRSTDDLATRGGATQSKGMEMEMVKMQSELKRLKYGGATEAEMVASINRAEKIMMNPNSSPEAIRAANKLLRKAHKANGKAQKKYSKARGMEGVNFEGGRKAPDRVKSVVEKSTELGGEVGVKAKVGIAGAGASVGGKVRGVKTKNKHHELEWGSKAASETADSASVAARQVTPAAQRSIPSAAKMESHHLMLKNNTGHELKIMDAVADAEMYLTKSGLSKKEIERANRVILDGNKRVAKMRKRYAKEKYGNKNMIFDGPMEDASHVLSTTDKATKVGVTGSAGVGVSAAGIPTASAGVKLQASKKTTKKVERSWGPQKGAQAPAQTQNAQRGGNITSDQLKKALDEVNAAQKKAPKLKSGGARAAENFAPGNNPVSNFGSALSVF